MDNLNDIIIELDTDSSPKTLAKGQVLMEVDVKFLTEDLASFVDHIRMLVGANVAKIAIVQEFAGALNFWGIFFVLILTTIIS